MVQIESDMLINNNTVSTKNKNNNNIITNNTLKFRSNTVVLPEGLSRTIFHRMDPVVKSLRSQANTICRNMLNEKYIRKSFNKFNYGYYYKDANNNIIAFIIWREHEEGVPNSQTEYKTMSVELLCTQITNYKLGKIILSDIDKYALRHKINKIHLRTANESLIILYESNGYRLQTDNLHNHSLMVKHIIHYKMCTNFRHTKTRKSGKIIS